METGIRGTFVISWTQTELDGVARAKLEALCVGSVWRWGGECVRVDGPSALLQLDGALGEAHLRKRAAGMVRRLMGVALASMEPVPQVRAEPAEHGFVVTDGRRSFTVTLIGTLPDAPPLLMFMDDLPPADTDLWVVRRTVEVAAQPTADEARGGVICFTTGTQIATPDGPRRVQDLRPGDAVQTKDNGAQAILWIGSRRMSGARLHAMPHLRPVRIRAGALGVDIPEGDLVVSPQHRLLVKGRAAQALFGASEVLMAAQDMLNERSITVDHAVREVTYVHLMLPQHQIVWANGVETESFHPANTSLDMLDPVQRQALLDLQPDLADDPHLYGLHVRRNLSAPEATILRHDTGLQLSVASPGRRRHL